MTKYKVISLIVIALAIFTTGPIVNTEETISLKQVEEKVLNMSPSLSNLDRYLELEENVADVQSNSNKTIKWYNGIAKTEYAIIYLHGYSSSRTEIEPVPSMVADKLKANIYYTRFKGHGDRDKTGNSFKGVSVANWDYDALEALAIGKMIGKKVIIMGHSTGCTFGTYLAYKYPEDIYAQAYLAPNYMPKDPLYPVLEMPWGKEIYKMTVGEYYKVGHRKEHEADEPVWDEKLYYDAVFAMAGIVKRVRSYDFSLIHIPISIVLSTKDSVVKSFYTQKVFNIYGSDKKELLIIDDSASKEAHTITGDIRDPSTIPRIVDSWVNFINNLD